ncbi:MAG: metal-dependent hydrolase [Actinomycetota bacterium]
MLFFHLGVTCGIVFATLGRRRIDYRVVMLGAILPDLVDKPLGRLFFEDTFHRSRLFGHTILFATVLLLGFQFVLRGDVARRWFILPIAAAIHLALDGMWNDPVTLFWPFFGTTFPPVFVDNYWLEVLQRPLTHPLELVKEVLGAAILIYLGFAYGLFDRLAFRRFLSSGKLEERHMPV